MDPPKYTNKAPVYTSNNGTYPTCYWTPTGQSNVRNHQGGYEKESGWDGVTSWDVSSDDYTKSYIKYGVEKLSRIYRCENMRVKHLKMTSLMYA